MIFRTKKRIFYYAPTFGSQITKMKNQVANFHQIKTSKNDWLSLQLLKVDQHEQSTTPSWCSGILSTMQMYKGVLETFILNNNHALSIMLLFNPLYFLNFVNLKCPIKKTVHLFALYNIQDITVKYSPIQWQLLSSLQGSTITLYVNICCAYKVG